MKRAWTPLVAVCLVAAESIAQPPPNYGIDFVTINAPNAPAYQGGAPFGQSMNGRGAVPYAYRIGRTEITTSQWMAFVNTFSVQAGFPLELFGTYSFITTPPVYWGAQTDPTYSGPGYRMRLSNVPNAGNMPVTGISWRSAAMYCNWLHNGQSSDIGSLFNGAYDTTTWGGVGNSFTDALTHLPGARFWIPTLDEWLLAAYYDPDRHGHGQGGWWQYPYMSDSPPVSGLPGVGQTSAGVVTPDDPTFGLNIPLGSYPDSHSAFGLVDLSGGAREWVEHVFAPNGVPVARGIAGSWGGLSLWTTSDHITGIGGAAPHLGLLEVGFRIASQVPSGSTGIMLGALVLVLSGRQRCGGTARLR